MNENFFADGGENVAFMKVLGTEVAPFNVRSLIVSLGTFNTNMGNAAALSATPFPDDYRGSFAEKLAQMVTGSQFEPDGDTDKATKAVYDVVVGEGIGKGREAERFLPLGRDLAKRVEQVQKFYSHAMDVFGEVCNNVYRDEKA